MPDPIPQDTPPISSVGAPVSSQSGQMGLPAGYVLKPPAAPTAPSTPSLPQGYVLKPSSQPAPNQQPQKEEGILQNIGGVGKALGEDWNPVTMAKGLGHAIMHPLDTLDADQANRDQISQKLREKFQATGKHSLDDFAQQINAVVPFLGTFSQHAGDLLEQGKPGEALGHVLSLALPDIVKGLPIGSPALSLPKPVANLVESGSERLYQGVLKPPPASYSPVEIETMIKNNLRDAIPVNDKGLAKLNGLIDNWNQKVAADIAKNPNAPVNKFKVASRLGEAAKRAANQVNPAADLETVAKSGNEFLETRPSDIPASEAQKIKVGTHQKLSDEYGQLSSAAVESQKQLARGIREELEQIFPEIGDKNAALGEDYLSREVLERAVNRTRNQNLISLGAKVIGAGVAGAHAGPLGAAGAMAGAMVLHYVLTDPTVVSKIAIGMNKASKGTVTIPAAVAKITGYASVLGNSIDHHRSLSEQPQSPPAEIQVPTP